MKTLKVCVLRAEIWPKIKLQMQNFSKIWKWGHIDGKFGRLGRADWPEKRCHNHGTSPYHLPRQVTPSQILSSYLDQKMNYSWRVGELIFEVSSISIKKVTYFRICLLRAAMKGFIEKQVWVKLVLMESWWNETVHVYQLNFYDFWTSLSVEQDV